MSSESQNHGVSLLFQLNFLYYGYLVNIKIMESHQSLCSRQRVNLRMSEKLYILFGIKCVYCKLWKFHYTIVYVHFPPCNLLVKVVFQATILTLNISLRMYLRKSDCHSYFWNDILIRKRCLCSSYIVYGNGWVQWILNEYRP